MAPRTNDQHEEFRQTLANFTIDLKAALQEAVQNALQTVLQQQHHRPLKRRAMAWWTQLKESRRRSGKTKIDSGEKLKKYMRRGFLPYNYERTLYTKLQNLRQGSRTVEEYASDFFEMTARITLTETEEQLVSRFIGGLRSQLQIPLQQFNPTSVSEAHQRALGMELQYKTNWNPSSSRNRFTTQPVNDSGSSQVPDTTATRFVPTRPGAAPD